MAIRCFIIEGPLFCRIDGFSDYNLFLMCFLEGNELGSTTLLELTNIGIIIFELVLDDWKEKTAKLPTAYRTLTM